MLWAVVIAAACWLVIQLAPVILALIVALFLVGTLNPAVQWLESKRMKRNGAIVLVFTGLLLVIVGLGALTLPSLYTQGRDLVAHEAQLRHKLGDWMSQTPALHSYAQNVRDFKYGPIVKSASGSLLTAGATAASYVAYLLSAVFLALYMMIDRDRLRGGVFALVPREHHLRLSRVLIRSEAIVGGYIRGQALTSGLMTVFSFILLTVFQVPSALALAVFAGLADVLPYIGPTLSIAPMAGAAVASVGLGSMLVIVAIMVAYEEFESRFLIPRIYGQTLRLPSSMVLLALLVGGTLMGIIGALLALPIAAAISMVVEELRVDLPGDATDDSAERAQDAREERVYALTTEGEPPEEAAAVAVEMAEERLKVQEKHGGAKR